MANRHNTEKSSTGPNQPHSQEVDHPTIHSKNTFKVPFYFIERYPLDIPIKPTPDLSYTSSPNTPHQDSSSYEEIEGVSSEEPLYLIPKTKFNQPLRHT